MSGKLMLLFAALLCTAAVSAQTEKTVVEGVKFDSKNLTYTIGTKQLKVNPDGTFVVLSSGRRLARTYFFIATPHKYWQTNQGGVKKAGEYEGKRIEVRDIKVDGTKIKVSGLVPWQKTGEKTLATPWTMTVTANGKGRFMFHYTYDVPEGQKLLDRGIFMEITNIKQMDAGQAGIWTPKDKKDLKHHFKPTILKLNGFMREDDFQMESSNWKTQGNNLRFDFSIRNKTQPSFIIELGK